jgi:GT2 family glycosyltransferase/glycosyltransferase involved in cell wall biosynthesis
MRALVVVHGFPPRAAGGSEVYAQAHARALRKLGDTVLVLTREADPTRAEYAQRHEARDGLDIAWINNTFRATRSFEDTYRNEAVGAIAERLIDEFRPDVAHVHHLTCLSTTIVESLAARGVPTLFTLHDYWLMCHRGQLFDVDGKVCDGPGESGCHRCIGLEAGVGSAGFLGAAGVRSAARILPEDAAQTVRTAATMVLRVWKPPTDTEESRRLRHMRAICARVTHFLAPSKHMRDRFLRFGIAEDRITISPYGFDHEPFDRADRTNAATLRIGFLGSLMVSKAPHVLLEAFARLPKGSATVDLFGAITPYHGDRSYESTLEPLMRQDGVRFHGVVSHEQIPDALRAMDVLVVPSRWPENSPLVIQEAFLAGVPVVASDIGGIPEFVTPGQGGLLFQPGDVDGLATLLRRLASDRSELEVLRQRIPAVRSIEDDVRGTRALLEVQKPRRPATAAIVLNYRTRDDTFLAVHSLKASTPPLDSIIVVDNSTPADGNVCFGDGATVIATTSNLGFSGGVNVGIRRALADGADRVLLVNSDVIVPTDCVAQLTRALEHVPGAGIVGPELYSRSQPDDLASRGMSYSMTSGRMLHRRRGEATSTIDGVSGCVMLIRREVFDAIGFFDERYFYAFEDLDFCLRARRAGFVTVLAGSAAAYHEGARSIGPGSPERLYFAARNHLLLSSEHGAGGWRRGVRASWIVALNVAHAFRSTGASLPARLWAVARGTRDALTGRFGPAPAS